MNRIYKLGVRRAFIKLGLMDAQSMRNYYPGIPRNSPMSGEGACGEYDPMELLKRLGRIDDGFRPMDAQMQDSGSASDISGQGISDGGDP